MSNSVNEGKWDRKNIMDDLLSLTLGLKRWNEKPENMNSNFLLLQSCHSTRLLFWDIKTLLLKIN